MKCLRFELKGRKHLVFVLEKENLERMVNGDPLDFDTEQYYYGPGITITVGYMEKAEPNDTQELLKHITRNVHSTPDDHTPPILLKSTRKGTA